MDRRSVARHAKSPTSGTAVSGASVWLGCAGPPARYTRGDIGHPVSGQRIRQTPSETNDRAVARDSGSSPIEPAPAAGRQIHLHERDERGGDQQLVGQWIHELAKRRHLLASSRQIAIQPVGQRGDAEDGRADQFFANSENGRPSNFVSRTTTRRGTRKIRPIVIAFGRFRCG